jgi:hypothetical protein
MPNDQITLHLGKACFVCEVASETDSAKIDGHADCSRCGPGAKIDWEHTQRVLEHMGAHILHDPKLNRTEERCGLCLRPAAMCPIYVTKGRGTSRRHHVDFTKSSCPNLARFNYKTASESSERCPCSNVPIICPLCPLGSPAIWTYNLEAHFRGRHRLTSRAHFPIPVEQSQSEKDGMKRVWLARFKNHKSYKSKKRQRAPALTVSEAHRSGLATV